MREAARQRNCLWTRKDVHDIFNTTHGRFLESMYMTGSFIHLTSSRLSIFSVSFRELSRLEEKVFLKNESAKKQPPVPFLKLMMRVCRQRFRNLQRGGFVNQTSSGT